MRWENMWQCEARLFYQANRSALGTKDTVTVFFPVCIITLKINNLSSSFKFVRKYGG